MKTEFLKAQRMFDAVEAVPVALRQLTWKTGWNLAKLELVLFTTKELVNEDFDRWFAENVFPRIWEANPEFASDFADLVENLASNPEYIVGALGMTLGLIALSGASHAVAIGVHLARERYIASQQLLPDTDNR